MKKALILLTISLGFASTDTTSISLTITDNTIDWVNLQYPESGTIEVGSGFIAYGQIYESGVTDANNDYNLAQTNPDLVQSITEKN